MQAVVCSAVCFHVVVVNHYPWWQKEEQHNLRDCIAMLKQEQASNFP